MKIYTLKGEWTKEGVEAVLGPPNEHWPWEIAPKQSGDWICGLTNVETESAGYGDTSACCRVHIHPEGICVHPPGGALASLFAHPGVDDAFTEAIYKRLHQAVTAARASALKDQP